MPKASIFADSESDDDFLTKVAKKMQPGQPTAAKQNHVEAPVIAAKPVLKPRAEAPTAVANVIQEIKNKQAGSNHVQSAEKVIFPALKGLRLILIINQQKRLKL